MSIKKSKIFQKGREVAIKAEDVCRRLPGWERYCLGQQLRNASRSIGANYVEGYVRQQVYRPDLRRFIVYSLGSCDETKYWLELGRDLKLVDSDGCDALVRTCDEIGRMLLSILHSPA
jgi:four helix bundle protein